MNYVKTQTYSHEAISSPVQGTIKIKLYTISGRLTETIKGIFAQLIHRDHELLKGHQIAAHTCRTFWLIRAEKGAVIPPHYHTYSQRIIMLSGLTWETERGISYTPGMIYDIPAHQNHGFLMREKSAYLVLIK